MPSSDATKRSAVRLEAGRRKGGSFHVIISEGTCSLGLMDFTNQSGQLYLEKLRREKESETVVIKINILLVCWQSPR